MALQYDVKKSRMLRVIVDTDAACEADDPFAIAHALLCKKFEVKAILAEHFGEPGSTRLSYEEICTVLDAMDKTDVPALMGEEETFAQTEGKAVSPGVQFLIDEAMRDDEKPLFVLCLGAITNVATAMRACPEIIKKMTVVWIGGQNPESFRKETWEFNAHNDIDAANYVAGSGVNFWQIPSNVYATMQISLAEIQRRIYPCGKIGKHLFENMTSFNMSEKAGWTGNESWSLGDSPAVGVALSPGCGRFVYRPAPIFEPDTTYRFEPDRPMIRVYTSIDSRFILEDLIAKLELCYGEGR